MSTTEQQHDSIQSLQMLVKYLIIASRNAPTAISDTKLYKLFYFIDFGHLAIQGNRITSFLYFKLPHGPVPDSLNFLLEIMESDEMINKKLHQGSKGKWHTYTVSEARIDLTPHFSAVELQTIEATTRALSGVGAADLSTISHWQYSWITSALNKPIDFALAKDCEFPWLGHYGIDGDEDYNRETMRLRQQFAKPGLETKLKQLKNLDFA